MPKITVDGIEIEVPAGTVLIEAIRQAGIEVPNFCYYPKLTLLGACRMCLVEAEGGPIRRPGIIASCVTMVGDGMIVRTNTPSVEKYRKGILEFLLVNHSLTCPTCDMGGECELQDNTWWYGPGESRTLDPRIHRTVTSLGPFIDLHMERCVQCQRCTRYCDEIMGNRALGMRNRGAATEIMSFLDQPLDCVLCGNCVEVCPVGALTSNVFDIKARSWDRLEVNTTCTHCGDGCSLKLDVKNNQVLRARAYLESGIFRQDDFRGINDEYLCNRGRFGYHFINREDRLSQPLVRRGGQLEPVSWSSALTYVAEAFKRIITESGPDAIGGIGSEKCTNEENYLFQKFMRVVIGTNNIDHRTTFKELVTELPPEPNTPSLAELTRMKGILVIGANPTEENPFTESRIRMAVRKNQATLVLADTRQSLLTEETPWYLQPKPGTESWLALSIVKALLEAKGLELPSDLASLQSLTLEEAERIHKVPAERLRIVASLLARVEPVAVLYGATLKRVPGGFSAIQALRILCRTLGWAGPLELMEQNNSLGARDMGVLPDLLPGYQPVTDPETRARFKELWGVEPPAKPGLNTRQMLEAAVEGKIRALYIMGSNPWVTFLDGHLVREALDKVEFLVVQDLFLTPTAEKADVVLPAVSFAEKEGTFTNLETRVQPLRVAVAPPGGPSGAQPDYVILENLAREMGASWPYSHPYRVLAEIGRATGFYAEISAERFGTNEQPVLGQQWIKNATVRGDLWKNLPSVPVELPADGRTTGRSPLHDEEYPYILYTGQSLFHTGTLTTYAHGSLLAERESFIEIHPEDAKVVGVVEGDWVEVSSPKGSLRVRCRVTPDVARGQVYIPIVFAETPVNLLMDRFVLLDRVKVVKVK